MQKRRHWLVALTAVLALLGAACGDDGDTGSGQTPTGGGDAPEFPAGSTMAAVFIAMALVAENPWAVPLSVIAFFGVIWALYVRLRRWASAPLGPA